MGAEKFRSAGKRTRVLLYLPGEHPNEVHAVRRVMKYLESQRTAPVEIQGWTSSRTLPTVFFGSWYHGDGSPPTWVSEGVVQLIFDVMHDVDETLLTKALRNLYNKAMRIYEDCGRPQEAFWLMAHPVIQFGRNEVTPAGDKKTA